MSVIERDGAWDVKVYRGKEGPKPYEWVGRFPFVKHGGKRQAYKVARAAEQAALQRRKPRTALRVDDYIERYLDDYREQNKDSSYSTARAALMTFKRDFGHLLLDDDSFEGVDCDKWAREHPSAVPSIVTALNKATARRDIALTYNPFRGLSKKKRGRKDKVPLSKDEVEQLAQLGRKLSGNFGATVEALIRFAAASAMRPGELFALEWGDIDLDRMRIMVRRRVYRGSLRLPKNNEIREIVLTPPARDALLLLTREGERVFNARRGGMLSQSGLSREWTPIANAFGERPDKNGVMATVDFYELRHRCAFWMLVELGMNERLVARQLGHTDGGKLVRELYGHGDHGALEEIDRYFAGGGTVTRLKAVGE